MTALTCKWSTEVAAIDAELAELASCLKTGRNVPARVEVLWDRIDRLLDLRTALVREDSGPSR